MGVDKPKYDFYENAMFLDDPLQADISRKARCTAPKIGTEPRVTVNCLIDHIDAAEFNRRNPWALVLARRASRKLEAAKVHIWL